MPNLRLSVSNIAWDVLEDVKVANFLSENQITAIDVAPSKYFSDVDVPSVAEVSRVREFWASFGIEIVGMQSLLFGTQGLNIFDAATHEALFRALERVASIASGLGAKALVFGSPKARDSSGLSVLEAQSLAREFFSRLGDVGLKQGVCFCLEPNPRIYGCNFITHSLEAAHFVRTLNHPGIKMQLDTGTVITNNEDFESEIPLYRDLVGHIHLSTTHLAAINSDREKIIPIIHCVQRWFSDCPITIEMVPSIDLFDSILMAKRELI